MGARGATFGDGECVNRKRRLKKLKRKKIKTRWERKHAQSI